MESKESIEVIQSKLKNQLSSESSTSSEKIHAPKCGMSVYPMRLKPGMEIKQCLEDFVAENGLNAAFILTCCGSVTKATLRFAANKNNETNRIATLEEHFEICSLVGTISKDGSHLHTTLSRNDGSTIGGHVMSDMIVFTTAEIVLGNCETYEDNGAGLQNEGINFRRKDDSQTGFPELVVCRNEADNIQ